MSTSIIDQTPGTPPLRGLESAISRARDAGYSRAEIDAIVERLFTGERPAVRTTSPIWPEYFVEDLGMPAWLEETGGSPDKPDGDPWTSNIFDTPEPEPEPELELEPAPPPAPTPPPPAPPRPALLRRLGRLPATSASQAAPAATTSKPCPGLRRLPPLKSVTSAPKVLVAGIAPRKDADDFLSCVDPNCP